MKELNFDEAVEQEVISESVCLTCGNEFFDEGTHLCPNCQKTNVEVFSVHVFRLEREL